jgi:hypothetical protein
LIRSSLPWQLSLQIVFEIFKANPLNLSKCPIAIVTQSTAEIARVVIVIQVMAAVHRLPMTQPTPTAILWTVALGQIGGLIASTPRVCSPLHIARLIGVALPPDLLPL